MFVRGVISLLAIRYIITAALPFDVLWQKVEISINSELFEEAEEHLATVLSLYPDKVDAIQLYGTLAVRRGDAEMGTKYLQRAVELGGWSNAVTVANYIQALRRCGRKDDAASAALQALKLFPDNVPVPAAFAASSVPPQSMPFAGLYAPLLGIKSMF